MRILRWVFTRDVETTLICGCHLLVLLERLYLERGLPVKRYPLRGRPLTSRDIAPMLTRNNRCVHCLPAAVSPSLREFRDWGSEKSIETDVRPSRYVTVLINQWFLSQLLNRSKWHTFKVGQRLALRDRLAENCQTRSLWAAWSQREGICRALRKVWRMQTYCGPSGVRPSSL